MINKFLDFLNDSPSSFNACENIALELSKNDFKELTYIDNNSPRKFFIRYNDSAIIAVKIGNNIDENSGFNIIASHSDCPGFKLKPLPLIKGSKYQKINLECYGGLIINSWLDRPLSLAGRLTYYEDGLVKTKVVKIDRDLMMIPNVAIHQNREINNGFVYNRQIDLAALIALKDFDFNKFIEKECNITNLLSHDLYVYPRIKAYTWGLNNEFIAGHHIDNLECAHSSLMAFINAENNDSINIYVCFDNEEVGSKSQQGADATILRDLLDELVRRYNLNYQKAIDNSMLVSADNAHASHPNHEELYDPCNKAYPNEGVVLKFNAAQSYTSDSLAAGLFIKMLEKDNIPYQFFANRSDKPGGGTLGNISQSHVSLKSIDIGAAQMAMHSSLESAGALDYEYLYKASLVFYNSSIRRNKDGFIIK